MKRIAQCLLAAVLALSLAAPASAAGVTLRYQEFSGGLRLTLEGLEEEVWALQLELTLEGEQTGLRFDPAPEGVYAPECRVEADRRETRVTVYMVAEEEPLGDRKLGTLTGAKAPAGAELLLLDREGKPIESGRVSLARGEKTAEDLSRVHIVRPEHGAVTVRPAGAEPGETVILSVTPEAGYALEAITARDSRDREVALTRDSLNRYTFSMPALDVEVTASFAPGGGLSFQDVRPGDWCYDGVRYVFEAGLMNGASAAAFTPDAPTTRGQIVAILYRLEGSPAAGQAQFSDVRPGAYYAAAVSWASQNGVVNGYGDNTFRPDNLITREQLAAFLYRYASQKGRDVSALADLSAFADAGQIASYAVTPLRWAFAAGLVNGAGAGTLAPGGPASRAQAAVILSRFVQNVL